MVWTEHEFTVGDQCGEGVDGVGRTASHEVELGAVVAQRQFRRVAGGRLPVERLAQCDSVVEIPCTCVRSDQVSA